MSSERSRPAAPTANLTRRGALVAPAVVAGAAGLTACGGGSDTASAGPVEVPVGDVPVEGGVVRDGVVITQPTKGDFHAFDARCPHQGCTVDEVTAEAISCPCHGSRFAPGDGSVVQGPATTGLTARTATVDGADVVVS